MKMAIGIERISNLISDKVRESLELDYKLKLPGKSDDDKKEFAIDVASFMNALGGEIIFGVAESEGLPVEIQPLTSIDRDAEEQRLNQILLDNVDPRGVYEFKWIDAEEGQHILSLKIPPSGRLPHRVNFKGRTHFYVRDSVGKHQMSMDELRGKFRGFNIAKNHFTEEVIQLSETFSGGAVFLRDKSFINCVLNGPPRAFSVCAESMGGGSRGVVVLIH